MAYETPISGWLSLSKTSAWYAAFKINARKKEEGGIPRKRLDNANLIGTPPKVLIKPLVSLWVKRGKFIDQD